MLSGRPKPLSAFGIDEPALQEILDRGLSYEKRVRVTELSELIATLDGWERDPRAMPAKRQIPPRPPASRNLGAIASASGGKDGDDGIVIDSASLPDDEGVELDPKPAVPPPVPAPARPPVALSPVAPPPGALPPVVMPPIAPPSASAPVLVAPLAPVAPAAFGLGPQPIVSAPSLAGVAGAAPSPIKKKLSINPFERKRSVWPLVLIAAVVGGGGVYLAIAPDAAPPLPVKEAPAAAAVLPKAPQPARQKLSAGERRDSCVASYFDPGAFEAGQNFAFVCEDGDFRDVAQQLQRLVRPTTRRGDDAGSAPDATRVDAGARASGLDWYELPAAAIIRKSCCDGATPVTLPPTPGWCEQLQTVVRRIADDSGKAGDLAPVARTFDRAVACLFANKVGKMYVYEKAPTDANRQAFQQFLSRAAISEARR
jgi:hypothetical protein